MGEGHSMIKSSTIMGLCYPSFKYLIVGVFPVKNASLNCVRSKKFPIVYYEKITTLWFFYSIPRMLGK